MKFIDLINSEGVVFVPLGTRCTSASVIDEQFNKRSFSLPFDWIDLPIENIRKFILAGNVGLDRNEVSLFLDNYFHGLSSDRHPDGTWFPHDIVKEEGKDLSVTVEEVKEKFKRRLNRFYDLIYSDSDIVFLTCIASEDKGNKFDFITLAHLINSVRAPYSNFFITVNLEDKEYRNGRHLNLVVPLEKGNDFSIWKKWEEDIANAIKNYNYEKN